MKAVYKHELRSYFTSVYAYVFSAFILLFAGIYCTAYNLKYEYAKFEYVPASMTFVFIIIVPIITMRVLAEERKQKTDQLLYSLPISMFKVIMGKYLAMLTVLLLPTAVMCIYPLILTSFGSVYLPAAYGAIAGFYFLGASLVAIGMFISALTESQAVAAGISFGFVLLNYFLVSLVNILPDSASASLVAFTIVVIIIGVVIKIMTRSGAAAVIVGAVFEAVLAGFYIADNSKFDGLFADIISELSVFERFDVFSDGIFDIGGIIYFVTVSGIFVYLSVQAMEKRRWN